MSSESNRGVVYDVTPSGEATVGGPPPSAVTIGHIVYACYAVSLFTVFPMIIGVVLAYVKRDDAQGTWLRSHFSWQIRTFWWGLLWTVLGWILFVTLIGIPLAYALWALVWLWGLYRTAKGWLRLSDAKEV